VNKVQRGEFARPKRKIKHCKLNSYVIYKKSIFRMTRKARLETPRTKTTRGKQEIYTNTKNRTKVIRHRKSIKQADGRGGGGCGCTLH
jgi:hypothetical protein